jgi:hypothetical protein
MDGPGERSHVPRAVKVRSVPELKQVILRLMVIRNA